MSDAITKVKTAMQLWKEGREKFEEANRVLSGGPAKYYFEKIENYCNALFNKYAPFKKDDRVRITKAPNTDNNWDKCKHFLIVGAIGTVKEVDYRDDKFTAEVIWDKETYINRDGEEKPVLDKHLFLMWEDQIEKISEDSCKQCGKSLNEHPHQLIDRRL